MLDRFAQFAIVAADEAWRQAGLELNGEGAGSRRSRHRQRHGRRRHPGSPLRGPLRDGLTRVASVFDSAHHEQRRRVAREHALRAAGPGLSMASACAAAAHAIGEAAEMIRAGRADVMVAGGADAPIAPGVIRCWEAMRVLAPAQTATPHVRAGRSAAIASGWCLAKALESSCLNRGSTRRGAARPSWQSWPATARPRTPDI